MSAGPSARKIELGARATKGASPVRILARRFADGLVDRRMYIIERRRLLDAIAAGELELPPDPVPADDPPRATDMVASALGEEDDTVELRLRQPAAAAADNAASAPADAAVEPSTTDTMPLVAADLDAPAPANTDRGSWWMVIALLTGLLGIAVWLWWELSPL